MAHGQVESRAFSPPFPTLPPSPPYPPPPAPSPFPQEAATPRPDHPTTWLQGSVRLFCCAVSLRDLSPAEVHTMRPTGPLWGWGSPFLARPVLPCAPGSPAAPAGLHLDPAVQPWPCALPRSGPRSLERVDKQRGDVALCLVLGLCPRAGKCWAPPHSTGCPARHPLPRAETSPHLHTY